MNVPMADLQAQHRALKPELMQAVEQVLSNCDFGGLGENTTFLEREIADYCGAKHALEIGRAHV